MARMMLFHLTQRKRSHGQKRENQKKIDDARCKGGALWRSEERERRAELRSMEEEQPPFTVLTETIQEAGR
jgi:hypothetical protein